MAGSTFKVLGDPMEKVRGSQTKAAKDGEAENVHLTTGKQLPQRRGLWILLAVVVALIIGSIGAVIGILVSHFHHKQIEQWVEMIPFVPLPEAPLNFIAIGNWGVEGQQSQKEVAQAMAQVAADINANFILSTGDNFCPAGLHNLSDPQFNTSFVDIYTAASLQKQWYTVLGDKDYLSNPTVELSPAMSAMHPRWNTDNSRKFFKACAPYMQTNNEDCPYNLELIFVDTSPIVSAYWDANGPEPLNFTSLPPQPTAVNNILNELSSSVETSQATWKVVVGHHPVYSTGNYGSTPDLQNYLMTIFKKANAHVDLYISGHNYNLELLTSPDVDTFFVTSGAGSSGAGGVRNGEIPGTSLFYSGSPGFVAFSVTGPTMDVLFYNSSASLLYNATLTKP